MGGDIDFSAVINYFDRWARPPDWRASRVRAILQTAGSLLTPLTFNLPIGLRLWENEFRRGKSPLHRGYAFSPLEASSDAYRITVMAEADQISRLFHSIGRLFGPEAFLILEFYPHEMEAPGEEPSGPTTFYSPYLPTAELLQALDTYLPRLIHDGFVGFGLANNRAGLEFFYSEEKVLTCFSGNHLRVIDLLNQHGLPHRPELLTPGDFGHDHLSLLCLPADELPPFLAEMGQDDLDYVLFCQEIVEALDMYPVEETLSFFLSKKEQDAIEACLSRHSEFSEFAEEDFGSLLLDWNDFVSECEAAFEGDLWEYQQGLKLRDMIQYVIEGIPPSLATKLKEILAEPDAQFQRNLIDRRKRLDAPGDIPVREERFWYQGVVRNQGAYLRRDLIRCGWFKP